MVDVKISVPLLSWFDEPAKQSIASVFDGINAGVEALDLYRKYKNAHFKMLQPEVSKIKILGMNLPLDLVDIYSPSQVSTTIHGRLYMQEWHRANSGASHEKLRDWLKANALKKGDDFIEKNDKVVVLGGPGSGKTTFLRFLALAYSNKKIYSTTNLKVSKLPMYISLPVFARKGGSLIDYITDPLTKKTDKFAANFLRRVFDKGLAILLLDSLDEVPLNMRTETIDLIKTFCKEYPQCKYVLSCRTADYEVILEEFSEVEIAKLTKQAVHKIIRAWFSADVKKAEQLIRVLKADQGVSCLTETPLLLSLLCIQFWHDLSLPKRKTELYRRCVDALLRDWDASRGFRRDSVYATLSDDRKERIFEYIAAQFLVNQNNYTFPLKEVIEHIGNYCERYDISRKEAPSILNEIEKHHGILEKFSVDSYSFSHPSFQEYFTARYAIEKRNEMELLKKYFENENWSSVIEFMVALREDPTEMLSFLMAQSKMTTLKNYPAMARRTRHLWLLYRCMSSGASVVPKFSRTILTHLVESQIDMASIYRSGGVFPVAVLMVDGIRHTYYFNKKRPTLRSALQPFRKLANQILHTPMELYSDIVLDRAKEVDNAEMTSLSKDALLLCLIIPLASTRPIEVKKYLEKIRDRSEKTGFKSLIDESLESLTTSYHAH